MAIKAQALGFDFNYLVFISCLIMYSCANLFYFICFESMTFNNVAGANDHRVCFLIKVFLST